MTLKTLLWGLALYAKAQGASVTLLATQPARKKTAVTARRRLSACAAGRAPLPGGGCGTEINGCWGPGLMVATLRAARLPGKGG